MRLIPAILASILFVPAIALPYQSFDEEMAIEYRPPDPLTAYRSKSESNWTGWNKFWFASAIGGQASDIASTSAAVNRGCSEANPLYGSDLNMGVMVLVKTALLGITYWTTEYLYDGDPGQQALRNWMYGVWAISGFAAAGWNMSQGCNQ